MKTGSLAVEGRCSQPSPWDVSNKEEEDQRVKMNTRSRRLPMDGQECQKKIASHRALSGLLRCGVRVCVCAHLQARSMVVLLVQSERESNMGEGLG